MLLELFYRVFDQPEGCPRICISPLPPHSLSEGRERQELYPDSSSELELKQMLWRGELLPLLLSSCTLQACILDVRQALGRITGSCKDRWRGEEEEEEEEEEKKEEGPALVLELVGFLCFTDTFY
ncbi:hypothetical protein FQA47_000049 [Oryzias melastigma]|uniref:Uncharacterized protein n=1 Tax=Oryzias melastigma TaxID=30732 RepID=A0A834F1X8_ORYME|nr:hypothetical protein FQA47_000049 [Oryzias melastigma]